MLRYLQWKLHSSMSKMLLWAFRWVSLTSAFWRYRTECIKIMLVFVWLNNMFLWIDRLPLHSKNHTCWLCFSLYTSAVIKMRPKEDVRRLITVCTRLLFSLCHVLSWLHSAFIKWQHQQPDIVIADCLQVTLLHFRADMFLFVHMQVCKCVAEWQCYAVIPWKSDFQAVKHHRPL